MGNYVPPTVEELPLIKQQVVLAAVYKLQEARRDLDDYQWLLDVDDVYLFEFSKDLGDLISKQQYLNRRGE